MTETAKRKLILINPAALDELISLNDAIAIVDMAEGFRLMVNCAELCQVSANLQLSGSTYSSRLCAVCAEVCQACADSCRDLDGMDSCVQACDTCAASCRNMSAMHH